MSKENGTSQQRLRDHVLPTTRTFRGLVGGVVVLATSAVLLARLYRTGELSQGSWLLLLAIVFTSLVGVYGRGAFSKAMDAVRGGE